MFKTKHFMDKVESDDGIRLWVEPIGLTRDMVEWCAVHHLVCQIAPPMKLWNWFEKHPDGYEFFRAEYHKHLNQEPYRQALLDLCRASNRETFTLLHQGMDPEHNTATALYEFLGELKAYCPSDE